MFIKDTFCSIAVVQLLTPAMLGGGRGQIGGYAQHAEVLLLTSNAYLFLLGP